MFIRILELQICEGGVVVVIQYC